MTIKSHFTRSLFLLLYLFSKIVLVPRKRLRNQAGGHSTFLPCMIIITCRLLICKLERQFFFMSICSYQSHTHAPCCLCGALLLIPAGRVLSEYPFLQKAPSLCRLSCSCHPDKENLHSSENHFRYTFAKPPYPSDRYLISDDSIDILTHNDPDGYPFKLICSIKYNKRRPQNGGFLS